jgi:hypothetical protein
MTSVGSRSFDPTANENHEMSSPGVWHGRPDFGKAIEISALVGLADLKGFD